MVRTKDLLLIVVVLVVLFMAISATLASRMVANSTLDSTLAGAGTGSTYEAENVPAGQTDRASTIARLRSQLAAGDVIEASPSVEVSPTPEGEVSVSSELACGTLDTGITTARTWPLANIEVKIVGATRIVAEILYAPVLPPAGTGTPPAPRILSERVMLQLPVVPGRLAEPTCLDSEIIGVTVDGSLMFNNDAVLHRTTSAETLIGYARDGFPIYGAYSGVRDQCGGYESATGYRYTASPTESTFLSCFAGSPQLFQQ